MVFLSTLCEAFMGLLSCALVNSTDTPGALAGAALIASEALRGTSSAALLCMILAIEYNTVLSFSKCALLSGWIHV